MGCRIGRRLPVKAGVVIAAATFAVAVAIVLQPRQTVAASGGIVGDVDPALAPVTTAALPSPFTADRVVLLAATQAATPTVTPTASPTVASIVMGATPSPTATPTPSPSAGTTVQLQSASDAGPSAPSGGGKPTPTPTPTGTPSAGNTAITPDNAQGANPGTAVAYGHTVTNISPTFDYKNIGVSSSLGWSAGLYQSDGVTPLVDNNSDGIPDTDRLNPGQSVAIVVRLAVPDVALMNDRDVTTVTASSGRNPIPANSATATDTTTVNGVLRLSISTSSTEFGQFAPDGQIDPAVGNLSSSIDGLGAEYVRGGSGGQGLVQVTVSSNGPWTGTCWAGENTGTSGIRIGDSRLGWRLAGTTIFNPFAAAMASPYDNSCFGNRAVGTNNYQYDFRLRVAWSDDPGTFNSVVTYAASN